MTVLSATLTAVNIAWAPGLRGVLVLSGKTTAADIARAAGASRASTRGPDAIAPTLADVVAALD